MLKKIVIISLLLFSFNSYACTCSYPPIPQRFINSDAVFKAEIVKVVSFYKNSKRPKRVQFNLIEDFKGTLTSRFINVAKPDMMCPVPNLQVGSTWLIFTNSSKNGILTISACNPSISFEKEQTKIEEAKLKMTQQVVQEFSDLENLNRIKSDNTFRIYKPKKGRRYALSMTGFNGQYGVYYLSVDPVFGKVTGVEVLKSLSITDDTSIIEVYKAKKIRNRQRFIETFKVPLIVWKTD